MLTVEEVQQFKQQIEEDLTSLRDSLEQASAGADTVILDQSSVGRLSRMDAMQQQAMAQEMLGRLLIRKRKLEAAIARIEAGSFGFCCQCEAPILRERLKIDPGVVFCAVCRED